MNKLLAYTFYLQIFTLVIIIGLSLFVTNQNSLINQEQKALVIQINQLTTKINSIQALNQGQIDLANQLVRLQAPISPEDVSQLFVNQVLSAASASLSATTDPTP